MPGCGCLLYTSDAADERSSVDLGGRRIIKKKKKVDNRRRPCTKHKKEHGDEKCRQYKTQKKIKKREVITERL
mgnify:CR=1 FL=1